MVLGQNFVYKNDRGRRIKVYKERQQYQCRLTNSFLFNLVNAKTGKKFVAANIDKPNAPIRVVFVVQDGEEFYVEYHIKYEGWQAAPRGWLAVELYIDGVYVARAFHERPSYDKIVSGKIKNSFWCKDPFRFSHRHDGTLDSDVKLRKMDKDVGTIRLEYKAAEPVHPREAFSQRNNRAMRRPVKAAPDPAEAEYMDIRLKEKYHTMRTTFGQDTRAPTFEPQTPTARVTQGKPSLASGKAHYESPTGMELKGWINPITEPQWQKYFPDKDWAKIMRNHMECLSRDRDVCDLTVDDPYWFSETRSTFTENVMVKAEFSDRNLSRGSKGSSSRRSRSRDYRVDGDEDERERDRAPVAIDLAEKQEQEDSTKKERRNRKRVIPTRKRKKRKGYIEIEPPVEEEEELPDDVVFNENSDEDDEKPPSEEMEIDNARTRKKKNKSNKLSMDLGPPDYLNDDGPPEYL